MEVIFPYTLRGVGVGGTLMKLKFVEHELNLVEFNEEKFQWPRGDCTVIQVSHSVFNLLHSFRILM